MSHAATNWAVEQRGLKPTTKIVLWHLCDRFNPDYGCFPSQVQLAYDCEISRATLNRHLDDLEVCGLIRRIRRVDHRTGQQRPTRYLPGFEPGFPPPGSSPPDDDRSAPFDLDAAAGPCPDLRHGPDDENVSTGKGLLKDSAPRPCLNSGHGAVSHSGAIPCLKNGDSRVSKRDTNPVWEPLSKPVKEEEGARADITDDFFEELLAALGCKIDGGQHKIGSYTHPDAAIIAAILAGLPDKLGGKRMAIRVAELAGAGLTPDWMPGVVPRCVPVDIKRNRHGDRAVSVVVGTERVLIKGKWLSVEVRACPVTFRPDAQQIEAARRGYEEWWQALEWMRDGLIAGGMLRAIEVTAATPKVRPWKTK